MGKKFLNWKKFEKYAKILQKTNLKKCRILKLKIYTHHCGTFLNMRSNLMLPNIFINNWQFCLQFIKDIIKYQTLFGYPRIKYSNSPLIQHKCTRTPRHHCSISMTKLPFQGCTSHYYLTNTMACVEGAHKTQKSFCRCQLVTEINVLCTKFYHFQAGTRQWNLYSTKLIYCRDPTPRDQSTMLVHITTPFFFRMLRFK